MASRSACGPPSRSCQPSATGSPSRAITAPTSGLGLTRPRPRSAISIARARCTRSVSVRTVILRPLPRILPRVRQPASEERAAAGYGRAAAILSVALALTGLLTFGFFSAASHVLDAPSYHRIVLLWSVMFIVISTLSLLVIPVAGRRAGGSPLAPAADAALEGPGAEGAEEALRDVTLTRGAGFAVAVLGIMAAEQALLNAPVLTVDAFATRAALAGFVFNVLLIARAPLQLFQAVQIALLPHLAGLEATAGRAAFRRAIALTALAIGVFSLAVTLGLL